MRLFSVVFLLFVLLPSLSFADCANRVETIQSVGDMKAAFRCLNDEMRGLKRELSDNEGEIKELKQQLIESSKGVVLNPPDRLPPPTISQTTTEREIKYDLLGCSNKNGKVECELRFTRLGADKNVEIHRKTIIYDENGNEYNASYMQIAKKSTTSRLSKTLISNIPTKVILRFNGVSPQATRIAVLKIRVQNDGWSWVSVRDIALKR